MSTAVQATPVTSPARHAGKVALVTGAGSGIGRAIARRLAREGARVGCLDVDETGLTETLRLIAADAGNGATPALSLRADVREREQVRQGVERVAGTFGKLDQLVNAAGIVTMTGFRDLTEEEWDHVMDVNLKGYFLVAQEAAKVLTHRTGAIVNISTVESEVIVSSSGHCQPHYNASKAGVKMLTKALAAELSSDGIRVNAVAPGVVETTFAGIDLHAPEVWAFMEQRVLVKRLGQPDDIAAAVSFLLSGEASYITGVQLPVDGGWLVR
jgi:NAD(P)-dependent dehydrogenase (short-subunit alcohol dehydrogenase family)